LTVTEVSPLIVCVIWELENNPAITGVTWNGSEALTQIAIIGGDGAVTCAIYGLKNPTATAANIVVTFASNPTSGAAAYAISTTGGDTVDSWRTASTRNTAIGTGPGLTLANSVSGDIVFHGAALFTTAVVWDGGETTTSTTIDNAQGSFLSGGLSTKPAVGSNTVVGCTDTASYGEIAVAVMAASGGSNLSVQIGEPVVGGSVF
jgi:hypothetical protein